MLAQQQFDEVINEIIKMELDRKKSLEEKILNVSSLEKEFHLGGNKQGRGYTRLENYTMLEILEKKERLLQEITSYNNEISIAAKVLKEVAKYGELTFEVGEFVRKSGVYYHYTFK